MSLDLKLDPHSHDILIEALDLAVVDGEEAVGQHVKQRLLAIEGEWFLDLADGLPWFTGILGKPQDINVVESLLKNRILSSPGVQELTAFGMEASDTAERTLEISFTVRAATGDFVTTSLEINL